jgi:large subunit ribosomal protein L23
VDVLQVRTINMRGKLKRLGRYSGQRSSWKKAIVTLKEGQTIEFFENI